MCNLFLGSLFFWNSLLSLWSKLLYKDKVIIAVAEFSKGASRKEPDDRSVTQKILTELHNLATKNPSLVVVELGQVVLDGDTAQRIGKEKAATAVIWGTYTPSPTHVLVTPHFEVISPIINI